jgi:hypothetical protein
MNFLEPSRSCLQVPILLIIWRRPNTLKKLIDSLRPVSPTHLYVACDGPRLGAAGEQEKVAATRSLIESDINWPCEVRTLYSETNLGCSNGPSQAITWFFEHVEEGIILEDDCIPHPDFFYFCSSLLEHYRNDTRVWSISGNNFQDGQWRGNGSYYFSRYTHSWGWASWRRCWIHYDPNLKSWPDFRDSSVIESIFNDILERKYWTNIWEQTHRFSSSVTWWDYQWLYAGLVRNALTALPNVNLVSNIGFGADSSHFKSTNHRENMTQGMPKLTHPEFVLRDGMADKYTFKHHFLGSTHSIDRVLLSRLKAYCERYLRQISRASRND